MPALSALPKTEAPATSRRMSRPEAGLATIPTQVSDTRAQYDAGGCAGVASRLDSAARRERCEIRSSRSTPRPTSGLMPACCAGAWECGARRRRRRAPGAPGHRAVLAADGRRPASTPIVCSPQRRFAADELDDRARGTRLATCIAVLRRVAAANFAEDAEHMMVVVDDAGRILWLEGHPQRPPPGRRDRVRARGCSGRRTARGRTRSAPRSPSTTPCRSSRPSTSSPSSTRGGARPRRSTTRSTGELLGVVDLSGPIRTAHPHSLALVMAAARWPRTCCASAPPADDALRQAYLEPRRPAAARARSSRRDGASCSLSPRAGSGRGRAPRRRRRARRPRRRARGAGRAARRRRPGAARGARRHRAAPRPHGCGCACSDAGRLRPGSAPSRHRARPAPRRDPRSARPPPRRA